MKASLITFCAICLLPLAVAGQSSVARAYHPDEPAHRPATQAETQEFTALLQEVAAAAQKHDTTAMARYLAAEYHHYRPDYHTSTRKAELAFIGSREYPFTATALAGPVMVFPYSTMAVTVANMRFGGKDRAGKAFASTLQMMVVWVHRDARWQIVVMQSKELPAKKSAKS